MFNVWKDAPLQVLEADTETLLELSRTQKIHLTASLSDAELRDLSADRTAALDVEDVTVLFAGNDHPSPLVETRAGQFCPCCVRNMYRDALHANHRWYVVVLGLGFTGVVRGHTLYSTYVSRISHGTSVKAGGKRAFGTREETEYEWRVAYYSGLCARVHMQPIPTVLEPSRTYVKLQG
jgi:hypothetical protein